MKELPPLTSIQQLHSAIPLIIQRMGENVLVNADEKGQVLFWNNNHTIPTVAAVQFGRVNFYGHLPEGEPIESLPLQDAPLRNVLTCVYCGHAYPEGTPPHGSQVLTDHIKECKKHPMRDAEMTIALLQMEMMRMIDAKDAEELAGIISVMEKMPDCQSKFIGVPFAKTLLMSLPKDGALPTVNGGSAIVEKSFLQSILDELGGAIPVDGDACDEIFEKIKALIA